MDRRNKPIAKMYQQKHLSARIAVVNVPIDNKITPYEVDELRSLRDKLNSTKSKMDKFYIGAKNDPSLSKKWFAVQNAVDIYRPMRKYIQEHFNAQLVTNAWMKYYEIYSQYDIIPSTAKSYKAFFNAELPGAALCAFNHFMHTMRPQIGFDWRASSIAPDTANTNNTDVLGDNYGLWEMNRSKWMMQLKDQVPEGKYRNNGDATIIDNLKDWEEKIGPKSPFGGVNLYSHDAGIDVSGMEDGELGFNKQEEANAKIHLGCALAGFMTLAIGGTFIAKQYTYFETFTWNLIAIYASMFEEFYICKPLTSRPYNSEIYLVGKNFKGMSAPIRTLLLSRLSNFNMNPFIPEDSLGVNLQQAYSDILRFARIMFGQQIQFIEENINLYDRYGNNIKALNFGLDKIRNERRDFWLRQYPMKSIRREDYLPQRRET